MRAELVAHISSPLPSRRKEERGQVLGRGGAGRVQAVGEGRTRRETPPFRPQSPAVEVSVNLDEFKGDLEDCKQRKDVSWVLRMKSICCAPTVCHTLSLSAASPDFWKRETGLRAWPCGLGRVPQPL